MQLVPFGNTGLLVSRMCFGAWMFGKDRWNIGGVEESTARSLVDYAIEQGINFFDTANVYSFGESESMLGKILNARRHHVIIATKVRGKMSDNPNDEGLSRRHIMASVEASLQRLQTDYIDLYQIHGWDCLTPLEETMRALDDVVHQGKVRAIGCSNLAAWQIAESMRIAEKEHLTPFVSLQAYYSLVGRDLEYDLIPYCQYRNLAIMTWSPLASGYLSGKYRRGEQGRRNTPPFDNMPPIDREKGEVILDALENIAKKHQTSVAAVALAWQFSKPVTSVIIGVKTLPQLQENLAAAQLPLTSEDIATLDAPSKPGPLYPHWMIAFQNQTRQPYRR